ncbi:hypothetical protein EKO23_03980 [Nocardioides guangzhouensis]|uniref:Uncharacterized protein n=1 Tax=Nocardioides guangzhouensis TaxID=2497878 RepID=A0A4Q4ZIA7_9ACTN|nr:hypothetical protein EKO23_03980 [Nocardioides guangzhouensis]
MASVTGHRHGPPPPHPDTPNRSRVPREVWSPRTVGSIGWSGLREGGDRPGGDRPGGDRPGGDARPEGQLLVVAGRGGDRRRQQHRRAAQAPGGDHPAAGQHARRAGVRTMRSCCGHPGTRRHGSVPCSRPSSVPLSWWCSRRC